MHNCWETCTTSLKHAQHLWNVRIYVCVYIYVHILCHSIEHSFWQTLWYSIWHSFWHTPWHSIWHTFCIYSDILSGILSRILSGIYSDILSGIFSGIYSDILFRHSFWHLVWHSFWRSIRHVFGSRRGPLHPELGGQEWFSEDRGEGATPPPSPGRWGKMKHVLRHNWYPKKCSPWFFAEMLWDTTMGYHNEKHNPCFFLCRIGIPMVSFPINLPQLLQLQNMMLQEIGVQKLHLWPLWPRQTGKPRTLGPCFLPWKWSGNGIKWAWKEGNDEKFQVNSTPQLVSKEWARWWLITRV